MLTIKFPNGPKSYPICEKYPHDVHIVYQSNDWELYVDAQFEGYTYYLEGAEVNVQREAQLINVPFHILGRGPDAPEHELASHNKYTPDLRIEDAQLSFKPTQKGYMLVTVEGTVTAKRLFRAYHREPSSRILKPTPFPFKLEVEVAAKPGEWQLEYAFGKEYLPAEETHSLDELVNLAVTRLREMADEKTPESTEVVSAMDWRDKSTLRCYGTQNSLILEGHYPVDGEFTYFVLAHRDANDQSTVAYCPVSDNPGMQVQKDEFFSVQEAETILRSFLLDRIIDDETYLLRKKHYLF